MSFKNFSKCYTITTNNYITPYRKRSTTVRPSLLIHRLLPHVKRYIQHKIFMRIAAEINVTSLCQGVIMKYDRLPSLQ